MFAFLGHLVLPALLTNPFFWGLLVILVIAAGIYLAPKQTLTVLTDARTWVAAGVFFGAITIVHLERENAALSQKLDQVAAQGQAQSDGHASETVKAQGQTRAALRTGRLRAAAAAAPAGQKEDAVLDALSADEDAAPSPVTPDPVVPTPKPRTHSHAAPPPVVVQPPQPAPGPGPLFPRAGGDLDRVLDGAGDARS